MIQPRLNSEAQLLLLAGDQVFVRIGERTSELCGLAPTTIRNIVSLANGSCTIAQIADSLGPALGTDSVVALLHSLLDSGVLQDSNAENNSVDAQASGRVDGPVQTSIALFGNSQLFEDLAHRFNSCDNQLVRAFYVDRLDGCQQLENRNSNAQAVITHSTPVPIAAETRYNQLVNPDFDDFCDKLTAADFVVCAIEKVPYAVLLELNRAALASATPCLFVTVSNEQAVLGPTVNAGAGACFHCCLLANDPLAFSAPELFALVQAPGTKEQCAAFLDQLAAAVLDEVQVSTAATPVPARTNSLLVLQPGEILKRVNLLAVGGCPDCGSVQVVPETGIGQRAQVHAAEEIAQAWQSTPIAQATADPQAYQSVGILGGGTAGYLAALALRRSRPELAITVIVSSRIQVIRVGEATTPELVRLLHAPQFLGFDVADFHQQFMPTFKLGIQFQWGGPAPYDFPNPFQRGRLAESLLYEGALNEQSLGAMLMARNSLPVFRSVHDGSTRSLLHRVRWAYHLDNRRFVAYLQQARAASIRHVDAEVVGIDLFENGSSVNALHTDLGDALTADLWLDCSGFRSLLMEQQMKSGFIDYASTLFTDRAIGASAPNGGKPVPYTHAQTMDAGWCRTIPILEGDHKGYVCSSAFMDETKAVDEMNAVNSGLGDHRIVHFRSGNTQTSGRAMLLH